MLVGQLSIAICECEDEDEAFLLFQSNENLPSNLWKNNQFFQRLEFTFYRR